MTDRREHISTNNRLKINQLCDIKQGSYTLPTCFNLSYVNVQETRIQANAPKF